MGNVDWIDTPGVYDYYTKSRAVWPPTNSEDFSEKPSRKVRVLAARDSLRHLSTNLQILNRTKKYFTFLQNVVFYSVTIWLCKCKLAMQACIGCCTAYVAALLLDAG